MANTFKGLLPDGKAPTALKKQIDDSVKTAVPDSGVVGYVLSKTSTGTAWQPAPTGLPSGGTPGQVLSKTATGAAWATPPSGIPSGGAEGQVLTRNADGTTSWKTVSTTTEWSQDAQAKVQGYWIVVSATEPDSPTYTTADGVTVPVVWQQPITVLVPVVPETPVWDLYTTTALVPDLVGIRYVLRSVTKDGATKQVDAVIPPGAPFDLKAASGTALPFTAHVEAIALPGYQLPAPYAWDVDLLDPAAVTLRTSDGFSGDGAVAGRTTDLYAGGTAVTWEGFGNHAGFSTTNGAMLLDPSKAADWGAVILDVGAEWIGIPVSAGHVRSNSIRWFSAPLNIVMGRRKLLTGVTFMFGWRGLWLWREGAGEKIPLLNSHPQSGRWILERFGTTFTVTPPGGEPISQSMPALDPSVIGTQVVFRQTLTSGNAGGFTATIDNLVASKIGF